jgi:aminopeptidase
VPTASRIAKSIVGQSLRPKPDEVVLISAYPHSLEVAEAVALECQKAGADPGLWVDTDGLFYGQFKNYSTESLHKVSGHCLGLLDYVDSYVWFAGPRNPAPMARVPKEKFAAQFEGEKAHSDKAYEKKPKNVQVTLGQVTRDRAKAYGFNYPKWKAMVEAATTVNLEKLGAFGKRVGSLLSAPVSVHVTADNGTDLRVQLAGEARKVHVFDGIIGEEDVALGTPGGRNVTLPAGTVALAPIETSAQGVFVADVPVPQRGRLVEGLSWTFQDGRVTDFSAKRNLAMAQTNWETASGAKDLFGGFGFGLNPKAKAGFLENLIASGSVLVAIGDNREFGGSNDSSYGFLATLAQGTVDIGGKRVLEGGKWVL